LISLALKKKPPVFQAQSFQIPKKIFAYNRNPASPGGLVQLPDKIVVRFALTIYPYSFGKTPKA
jgi:hypothetical protein